MRFYLFRHAIGKLPSTVAICYRLFMARTFGTYIHSGHDGKIGYARYQWRGEEWIIPTGPAK